MAMGGKMNITVKQLVNLKKGKWLSHPFGHGRGVFTVRKTNEGIIFYFRYTMPGGKRDTFKFGTYNKTGTKGGMTLAQAKEQAGKLSKTYQEHQNLRLYLEEQQHQERDQINRERKERDVATFKALLDGYIFHLERQGKKRTAQDVRGIFNRRIFTPFPNYCEMKANNITVQNLTEIIAAVVSLGIGREASKLRSYMAAAFSAAIKSESDPEIPPCLHGFKLSANPAASVASLSKYNKARDVVLTRAEFIDFWKRIKDTGGVTGAALRLCVLLGGQRPFQLLRLHENDINWEDETITLFDTKGNRSEPRRHILPITKTVKKELELLLETNRPYLFSSRGGNIHLGIKTLSNKIIVISKKMTEKGVRKASFQLRDIRRTIETILASLNVSKDVRAQLQSHGLSGVQDRHYDKYDYLTEKKAAMEKIYDLLS
jgi:integrase